MIDLKNRNTLIPNKITKSKVQFNKLRSLVPNRLNVLAQGDSWFAYPKKWIIIGNPSNLIDFIYKAVGRSSNFYSMASNGAEALDMLSGNSKHELIQVLKWHLSGNSRVPVDLLLFSGGGNSIVGEDDAERFLRPYKKGFSAKQCVRMQRLKRKCKQNTLALNELIDICRQYSPNTIIITHTYDYPHASLQGVNLLGGLIKTKSWVKPYMDEYNIPDEIQCDIMKIFMDTLADGYLELSDKYENLIVVDTRGTIKKIGDWTDEIHPNNEGFGLIANKIIKVIKKKFIKLN